MTFTDDDLKKLKEMVVTWQFSAEAIGNYLRAHEGIFARLEAAENVCHVAENHLNEPPFFTVEDWIKCWRKAAGK